MTPRKESGAVPAPTEKFATMKSEGPVHYIHVDGCFYLITDNSEMGRLCAEGFIRALNSSHSRHVAEKVKDLEKELEHERGVREKAMRRLTYYENCLTVGPIKWALENGESALAINPERVGDVLKERDKLKEDSTGKVKEAVNVAFKCISEFALSEGHGSFARKLLEQKDILLAQEVKDA